MKFLHSDKLTAPQRAAILRTAARLGWPPGWLTAVMWKESRLNPRARNESSKATGLIQFMPSTAKRLGTDVDTLRNLSFVQQMPFVEKYLWPYRNSVKNATDAYFSVFFPKAIGKSDGWELPAWVTPQNRGLDLNKNGRITVGEIKRWFLKGQEISESDTNPGAGIIPLVILGGLVIYLLR